MSVSKKVIKDASYWNKMTSTLKKTYEKSYTKPAAKKSPSKGTKK